MPPCAIPLARDEGSEAPEQRPSAALSNHRIRFPGGVDSIVRLDSNSALKFGFAFRVRPCWQDILVKAAATESWEKRFGFERLS